ncbi:LON peptidase substrate-binding domain-containing protein [Geodermatophilus obscurus]|uniref:Peptidase S16 lon domain protein n=1 Tax=Geodermatophilus obscurus (strain ATCC 25078 / DSM 43160 / JCM 3152 / CCUG 61914 / KCC A-0152 / KCTC 9177 / NBRC 13315 / NRRL B-3577 / G-20) TaxID=526225 RepID=D2SA33_GEOOG|nr:LON peptidase substrate-binding domain-containing protein [Geodermatophilus obscurus]ADB75848.1 peptidase S16 lon domain protein [Geodermatophilus obscurus DSM 43160]
MDVIPLFPLGTPLFPGVVLPLQVFEPRYRRLVRDLLELPEGAARCFGVVAIRQGWEVEDVAPAEALYDVGCTARLQTVRPQPDGGFRIVTVGGDRFRLLDLVVGEEPPYLQAEVEWLAEEEAAEEAAGDQEGLTAAGGWPADPRHEDLVSAVARGSMDVLVRGVGALFGRYVTAVATLTGDVDGEEPDTADLLDAVSGEPRALSYLVASAALLTTEDRQELLAESATRRRLQTESRLLRRELTLLETIGAVPAPLQRFTGPRSVN